MRYNLRRCSHLNLPTRPPMMQTCRFALSDCPSVALEVTADDIAQRSIAVHLDAAPAPFEMTDGTPILLIWESPMAAISKPPSLLVEAVPESARDRALLQKGTRGAAEIFPISSWMHGRVPEPEATLHDGSVAIRADAFIGEIPSRFRIGRWNGEVGVWVRPEAFPNDILIVLDDEAKAHLRAALEVAAA